MSKLLGALFLYLAAQSALACPSCIPVGDAVFKELTPKTTTFHDYQIRLYLPDNPNTPGMTPDSRFAGFEILKNGKRVYAQTGYSFAIGYFLSQDQSPDSVKLQVGNDLTGEGVPELLISEWSGGAHCCYTFHLFRLGPQFSHIQDISLRDADESAFVHRDGMKSLVLVTNDYSAFAYFPSSFAGSPAGRVFLSFQDGRFRPDASLMKSSAPKPGEIAKCAALFKPSRDWKSSQPIGMWYYATDLIYTGNEAEAWDLLDAAWGGSAADKKKYLDEYRSRLRKSVYYPELDSLQKAPASNAGQKIDWTKQCFEYLRG